MIVNTCPDLESLIKCSYCDAPLILLSLPIDTSGKREERESQGPKTYPNVKRWCGGECYEVLMPIELLHDSATRAKLKSKEAQRFRRYVLKSLKRAHGLICDAVKEIRNIES